MEQGRLVSFIRSKSPGSTPGPASATTQGEAGLSYGLGHGFEIPSSPLGNTLTASEQPLKLLIRVRISIPRPTESRLKVGRLVRGEDIWWVRSPRLRPCDRVIACLRNIPESVCWKLSPRASP